MMVVPLIVVGQVQTSKINQMKKQQESQVFYTSVQYNDRFAIRSETGNRNLFEMYPSIQTCTISCGVMQMYALPANSEFHALDRIFGYDVTNDIVAEELKYWIEQRKHELRAAYFLASNNNTKTRINEILDMICKTKTPFKLNPNSGNQIRVWVV